MTLICRIALWPLLVMFASSGLLIAQENDFDDKFCIHPPHDRPCATFPNDQADFDASFEYMNLVKGAQDPFDVFSWQAFVALNWPADVAGNPLDTALGRAPDRPRVWERFFRRDEIFRPDEVAGACSSRAADSTLLIGDVEQSDGTVLIDQDLNFVVYDTRLNRVAGDYIRQQGLQTVAGQKFFDRADDVSFPQGRLPDGANKSAGAIPSILVKTSWRIVSDARLGNGMFTRDSMIHVAADKSDSREDLCLPVRLGLVGMHVVVRTESGNGDEWIWATFEHVDNAPIAANARNVNSIYSNDLFPDGCEVPSKHREGPYSFFDPDCADCPINTPQGKDWSWAPIAPYARIDGRNPAGGTQVVRCWDIFESTADLNRRWQGKLRGTVWSNYVLVSTQWRGAAKSPIFEQGEVPRYLSNTTLETYLQTDRNGSCMGCHAEATSVTGVPSNFSFLLRHAN